MKKSEVLFELDPNVKAALGFFLQSEKTDPAECLALAEKLVWEARKQFDNSASSCECCGLRRYPKYAEHLMHERLTGSAKKLRECAAEVERKWPRGGEE